jgi:hypothetical protein
MFHHVAERYSAVRRNMFDYWYCNSQAMGLCSVVERKANSLARQCATPPDQHRTLHWVVTRGARDSRSRPLKSSGLSLMPGWSCVFCELVHVADTVGVLGEAAARPQPDALHGGADRLPRPPRSTSLVRQRGQTRGRRRRFGAEASPRARPGHPLEKRMRGQFSAMEKRCRLWVHLTRSADVPL